METSEESIEVQRSSSSEVVEVPSAMFPLNRNIVLDITEHLDFHPDQKRFVTVLGLKQIFHHILYRNEGSAEALKMKKKIIDSLEQAYETIYGPPDKEQLVHDVSSSTKSAKHKE